MSEYAAPYKKTEGFENPDMQHVFNSLLTVTPIPPSGYRGRSAISASSGSECSANPGQTPLSMSDGMTPPAPTSFLKTMLIQQRDATKALMNTAKRIGPATQSAVQMEQAYTTAFENDLQASLPDAGGTLQGFILLFFIVSYLALTLVSTLMVNLVSGSVGKAGATFAAFILLGILIAVVLARLG